MGVLDSFFSDNPNDAAYTALMAGLLSGKGSFSSIAGNSLLGAQGAYSQANSNQLKNQATKLQIEEMARKLKQQQKAEADQEAFRETLLSLGSPQMRSAQDALSGGGGPTVANAEKIRQVDPTQSLMYKAMETRQVSPLDYIKLTQKDTAPQKVGAGERVYSHDYSRVLAENPKEADPNKGLPSGMRMGPNGPEWIPGYLEAQERLRRAGAVNVSYGAPVAGLDKDGNPVFFQPPKQGGKPSIVPGVTPPDATKPPTEFEAKAGLYFKSMQQASQTLDQLEGTKAAVPSVAETIIPNQDAKTLTRDKDRQKYTQAARQWLDSINRVRSGAQLPEIEYDRGMRTYFPTFGENNKSVQQQKARARKEEEQFLRAAAGRALPQNSPGAKPPVEQDNNDPLGIR